MSGITRHSLSQEHFALTSTLNTCEWRVEIAENEPSTSAIDFAERALLKCRGSVQTDIEMKARWSTLCTRLAHVRDCLCGESTIAKTSEEWFEYVDKRRGVDKKSDADFLVRIRRSVRHGSVIVAADAKRLLDILDRSASPSRKV